MLIHPQCIGANILLQAADALCINALPAGLDILVRQRHARCNAIPWYLQVAQSGSLQQYVGLSRSIWKTL